MEGRSDGQKVPDVERKDARGTSRHVSPFVAVSQKKYDFLIELVI